MPKRIVDGEAVWLSNKLKKLPKEFRLHYANWVPLAEANGSFEADPERIWARVYAFLLPEFTVRKVKSLIQAFIDAKLLVIYQAEGKTWGYFVGIEKKGRLPGLREIGWYKNLPPAVPPESLPDEGD